MNKYLASARGPRLGLLGSGFTSAAAGVVISETETDQRTGQLAVAAIRVSARMTIEGNKKRVSNYRRPHLRHRPRQRHPADLRPRT